MVTDKATIKIEKEDEHQAPEKPCLFKNVA